jgi:hypothetical protein
MIIEHVQKTVISMLSPTRKIQMLQLHSADFEMSPAKESQSLIKKIYRGCYGNTEIITDIENLVNLSHHKGTVAEMVFLANPTYLYKCIRRISDSEKDIN